MSAEMKVTFETMAVSNASDDEHTEEQNSLWTPKQKGPPKAATQESVEVKHEEDSEQSTLYKRVTSGLSMRRNTGHEDKAETPERDRIIPAYPKETVLAYWDPDVYHSKIWPVTCLFGASFGALHLISWDTEFPTLAEQWLWRAAAITSIVSLLIFMHYEKVLLRWGGALTLLSIVSPMLYLLSRVVMIRGAVAAFRAMDPKIYETYVVSTYWIHTL
ncbi:MAG: hypothetical protein M1820_008656 [Bogoriella megaspora]|nr:MAG: hypothetical protein M1820_008656 [Bogoriella megaspora]